MTLGVRTGDGRKNGRAGASRSAAAIRENKQAVAMSL